MRTAIRFWRDSDNNVYAEEVGSGARYLFLPYAQAASANFATQTICAAEFINDMDDFLRWLDGADLLSLKNHTVTPHGQEPEKESRAGCRCL